MKIAFYETQDWEEQYLREQLAGHDLQFFKRVPDDMVELANVDILSPVVTSRVSREMVDALPELKFIATRSTGFDHIDITACAARGIMVSNVPTYGEHTVAEFTFALLLALSRKIYPSVERVKEQGLFSSDGLQGFDLAGKTLGVVGTGHIGANVIRIAKGFDMNVVAFDSHKNTALSRKYKYRYVSLENLLGQSDIITLHVPYMPATHHLLNSKNIKHIKPGAVLVNTARGGLIETQALVAALKSGLIAGAALDVLEEEGHIQDEAEFLASGHPKEQELKILLADHALMAMDNVILTPHNAFNTQEAIERILDATVENIKGFVHGQPKNVV